jgi:hypothetical protein
LAGFIFAIKQTYLQTPSLLHFALGRAFEIAQRCSFRIFLGPLEDRFVILAYGALQHNFKGRFYANSRHL